jgi:hypothetical protein
MTQAFLYLAKRFVYRILDFLRHWYVKSIRYYSNFCLDFFERLDRFFAWKITAQNIFKPLYGDYSLVGYVMGFLFRSARLLGTSIVYLFLFLISVVLYLIWVLVPPALLFNVFN